MIYQHANLAAGGWGRLTLAEQLGNIGSEVSRALKRQKGDQMLFQLAIDRALELLDLTIQDQRWKGRQKEIVRAREVLCDAVFGRGEYRTSLADLDRYFYQFAFAARISRTVFPGR